MILNEFLKVISRRNYIIAFFIMLAGIVAYTALLPIEDSSQTAYNEFRSDISGLSDEEIGVHLEELVLIVGGLLVILLAYTLHGCLGCSVVRHAVKHLGVIEVAEDQLLSVAL